MIATAGLDRLSEEYPTNIDLGTSLLTPIEEYKLELKKAGHYYREMARRYKLGLDEEEIERYEFELIED